MPTGPTTLAEQPAFGRLGATRFRSTNRRRNGFHRVAPAALEDAVLESSHAGVYTLQIHAFATRRAARTFGRQQLRYSTSAHGHSPNCRPDAGPATGALAPDDIRVEPRVSRRSALLVPDRAELDRLADQHRERELQCEPEPAE
jgi:hypothetical protein